MFKMFLYYEFELFEPQYRQSSTQLLSDGKTFLRCRDFCYPSGYWFTPYFCQILCNFLKMIAPIISQHLISIILLIVLIFIGDMYGIYSIGLKNFSDSVAMSHWQVCQFSSCPSVCHTFL